MKSETRANLIFLIVLLCLMIPGVTIVLVKVYRSGGREFMPPPVRSQLAYLDPTPEWTALPRVTPPNIGSFVTALGDRLAKMQPGMKSIVANRDFTPVMSKRLRLQLIAKGADGQHYRLAMIGWTSKFAPFPELYKIKGYRGNASVEGKLTEYEPQNLPLELKTELQNYGYILPPGGILWMIVTFPGDAPIDSIDLKYHLDNDTLDDTLDVSPVAATSPATAP